MLVHLLLTSDAGGQDSNDPHFDDEETEAMKD